MIHTKRLFARYTTANLANRIDPHAFRCTIESWLGSEDWSIEGYSEEEAAAQRDLSVKFCWGHDHDFGEFALQGRMGSRHLKLVDDFVELFAIGPLDFAGKQTLDVGCWTGGTSLILAALGARVTSIEEVKKYANAAEFLVQAFGLSERVSVRSKSVYELNSPQWIGRYELVFFPGVLYHLSDPLLALRILYNSLKIGGKILLETAGLESELNVCSFEGPEKTHRGTFEERNRGGWNWFVPSPLALERMMAAAGFDAVRIEWQGDRLYAVGCKSEYRAICKAGLSVTDLP